MSNITLQQTSLLDCLTETVLLSPTQEYGKAALNYLREQGFTIALTISVLATPV
ncbi:hypothetical protein OK016_25335 [Vibrio chagasii]|nr:hypothetical protein [Vibrio chagasii]